MKKVRVAIISFLVLMILLYGTNAYINDFYSALDTAVAATKSTDRVEVTECNDALIFTPTEEDSIIGGLIFYPGGKVEYTAYAPLMQELAENGYLCILPHLTCNLAFLETKAADGFQELYPDIENWYMGGHSLGGVAASTYVFSHKEDYDGLIFLASYPTKDFSDSDLQVLSIYGSEDQVLKFDKYEAAKAKLPNNAVEYVIDGGNHAYFGSYGKQDGDGTASITNAEQISTTVDFITSTF